MGILSDLQLVFSILSEIQSVLTAVSNLPANALPAAIEADVKAVQTKLSNVLDVVGVLDL